METITITDLEVWTHIGVPEEERAREQCLLVTVSLSLDTSKAAKDDDVTKSVNYDDVAKAIRELAKTERMTLETFGTDIADMILLKEFLIVEKVEVTVRKSILAGTKDVSFHIVRP